MVGEKDILFIPVANSIILPDGFFYFMPHKKSAAVQKQIR
jgi:hypothetical protein